MEYTAYKLCLERRQFTSVNAIILTSSLSRFLCGMLLCWVNDNIELQKDSLDSFTFRVTKLNAWNNSLEKSF